MTSLEETARAKVNLTLKVYGRRADGLHEIESLAVFSGLGDRLELTPGGDPALTISGPFAQKLIGDNLVLDAVRLLTASRPGIESGQFRLEKRLPVSAGLGGGSADAAAALRLLQRLNEGRVACEDLRAVAGDIGSDVPVCLASRASMMRGRGERLSRLPKLPEIPAVLVNPGVELGAGEVYAALNAGPAPETEKPLPADNESFATIDDLVGFVRLTGNDLEANAITLAPVIGAVRTGLAETEGCLLAQMTGSGPTCFGIYATRDDARAAARVLARRHPDWWVVSTDLG